METWSKLDAGFYDIWNQLDTQRPIQSGTLPQSLDSTVEMGSEPENLEMASDTQRADILVTRHWLQIVVWQSAVKRGLLSSAAAERSMTFHYPEDITLSLLRALSPVPPDAIEIHGVGIVGLHRSLRVRSLSTKADASPLSLRKSSTLAAACWTWSIARPK